MIARLRSLKGGVGKEFRGSFVNIVVRSEGVRAGVYVDGHCRAELRFADGYALGFVVDEPDCVGLVFTHVDIELGP